MAKCFGCAHPVYNIQPTVYLYSTAQLPVKQCEPFFFLRQLGRASASPLRGRWTMSEVLRQDRRLPGLLTLAGSAEKEGAPVGLQPYGLSSREAQCGWLDSSCGPPSCSAWSIPVWQISLSANWRAGRGTTRRGLGPRGNLLDFKCQGQKEGREERGGGRVTLLGLDRG